MDFTNLRKLKYLIMCKDYKINNLNPCQSVELVEKLNIQKRIVI